jgi:hypothetical protein
VKPPAFELPPNLKENPEQATILGSFDVTYPGQPKNFQGIFLVQTMSASRSTYRSLVLIPVLALLVMSCSSEEEVSPAEIVDPPAETVQEDSIAESVDRLLEERRLTDAEAREREREFIRYQMERERQYKEGVALQIHLAKKALTERETAFENFYLPPERCRGKLWGSVSNECIQLKMDARKAFMLEYDRAAKQQYFVPIAPVEN